MLNSGRIVLPRHDRLFNQIVSLERRVARGGHATIDHPAGQHDDLANAVAGCAREAFSYGGYLTDYRWVNHDDGDEPVEDKDGKVLGTTRGDEHGAALARSGQAG